MSDTSASPSSTAGRRRTEEIDSIPIGQDSGGQLKGYVIDLRNNPGGLLDQAIRWPTRSSNSGEIVSIRGRDPDQTQRYNAGPATSSTASR